MSYTPVPAGGIEPPHDGATTRYLPTWLSRRLARGVGAAAARNKGWSRKQGSNLRLTTRMKPPLYRLSYSAVLKVAAPLGFEPSRPSSKPGALPARRRGNALVPRAGFEPAPSDLKDRCPRPLDERGDVERAARIELASSVWKAAALPLSYARVGGWCRDRTCATQKVSTR
jgi:hypothetical protein